MLDAIPTITELAIIAVTANMSCKLPRILEAFPLYFVIFEGYISGPWTIVP